MIREFTGTRVRQLFNLYKWRYAWAGARKRLWQPKHCPCCGSSDSDRLDSKVVYSLERCHGCRVCYKYPSESAAEMETFYQEEYGRNEPLPSHRVPTEAELEEWLAKRFAGTMLNYAPVVGLLRALGVPPGARLLDFGASWGYGVWQFRQAGYDAVGFEISRPRAAFGQRLGVPIHSRLEDVGTGFDVVYSSHVLEHVPNPLATVQDQLRLTRAGGFVIAHTPSACAAFRAADPPLFHLAWGLNHPVLLNDEFVRQNWPQLPCLLSSGNERHAPASAATWDRLHDRTDDLSQPEMLFILCNRPRG